MVVTTLVPVIQRESTIKQHENQLLNIGRGLLTLTQEKNFPKIAILDESKVVLPALFCYNFILNKLRRRVNISSITHGNMGFFYKKKKRVKEKKGLFDPIVKIKKCERKTSQKILFMVFLYKKV